MPGETTYEKNGGVQINTKLLASYALKLIKEADSAHLSGFADTGLKDMGNAGDLLTKMHYLLTVIDMFEFESKEEFNAKEAIKKFHEAVKKPPSDGKKKIVDAAKQAVLEHFSGDDAAKTPAVTTTPGTKDPSVGALKFSPGMEVKFEQRLKLHLATMKLNMTASEQNLSLFCMSITDIQSAVNEVFNSVVKVAKIHIWNHAKKHVELLKTDGDTARKFLGNFKLIPPVEFLEGGAKDAEDIVAVWKTVGPLEPTYPAGHVQKAINYDDAIEFHDAMSSMSGMSSLTLAP
ncbi:unnamed protein product [Pedinophyceae sp. YPF-701]|nr:unnamed protein product [Pedinophyceae sp. YPF-701]